VSLLANAGEAFLVEAAGRPQQSAVEKCAIAPQIGAGE
jgi:hypothetical protein